MAAPLLDSLTDLVESLCEESNLRNSSSLPINALVDLQVHILTLSKKVLKYLELLHTKSSDLCASTKEASTAATFSPSVAEIESKSLERKIISLSELTIEQLDKQFLETADGAELNCRSSKGSDAAFLNVFSEAFGDELDRIRKGTSSFDQEKLNRLLATIDSISHCSYDVEEKKLLFTSAEDTQKA